MFKSLSTFFKELSLVFKEIKSKTKNTYTIEHHFSENRYYPKLGGMFMIRNKHTKCIDLVERYMMPYSLFFPTKEDAIRCINEYKNQQELEKVETIEVD
jgi:hypothetical protein